MSFDILFASSNANKFREAKQILAIHGIKLGFFKCKLEEIQGNSIEKIAIKKVADAFNQCSKPVIIEDDGLFIESLHGFPGPYSSFVFESIGNNGILKLVGKNRNAKFHSVIAFCNKKMKLNYLVQTLMEKFQKILKEMDGDMIQFSFHKAKKKPLQKLKTKMKFRTDILHYENFLIGFQIRRYPTVNKPFLILKHYYS